MTWVRKVHENARVSLEAKSDWMPRRDNKVEACVLWWNDTSVGLRCRWKENDHMKYNETHVSFGYFLEKYHHNLDLASRIGF